MRKFIFIAILVSIIFIDNVSAQVIKTGIITVTELEKIKKSEFCQYVGVNTRVFANQPRADMTLGAFYEAGVMISKSFFVGGGLGVDYVFDHYSTDNIRYQDEVAFYDEYGITAEAYVNAKFYLTKKRFRPYFDISVGGIFGNEDELIYDEQSKEWAKINNTNKFNVFANPQFGISYNIGRGVNDVFVGVGYFQSFKIAKASIPLDANGSITLKLGISF